MTLLLSATFRMKSVMESLTLKSYRLGYMFLQNDLLPSILAPPSRAQYFSNLKLPFCLRCSVPSNRPPTYAILSPQKAGTKVIVPHGDNNTGGMPAYSDEPDAKSSCQEVSPHESVMSERLGYDPSRRPTTPVSGAASNTEKEKRDTDYYGREPSPLSQTEDERGDLHLAPSFLLSLNNTVNEWWLWELFGWLLSLLALAVLIAVLAIQIERPHLAGNMALTSMRSYRYVRS